MYKIYKIVDNTNNNVYIGLTTETLKKRMYKHKYEFKIQRNVCSSKIILKNNDWYFELIEETDDKEREKYWIQNTNNCINKIKYIGENIENRNKTLINWKKKNLSKYLKYNIDRYNYINSWGGDPRNSNSLLNIDVNLFI